MAFASAPIVLFCDFGLPYTGQMKGRIVDVLGSRSAAHPLIDLFWDVPAYNIQAGSVLLAAHGDDFPPGTVFVCVVDPGVGTPTRRPGAVLAGGRWFVGPLNGLFEHVLHRWRVPVPRVFEITWRPDSLSATFHGRDLFAPMAAQIAVADGAVVAGLRELELDDVRGDETGADVGEVIYIDGFGNLLTGLRWENLKNDQTLEVQGQKIPRGRTFCDHKPGQLFIYKNAVGLVEIAANMGNAQKCLDIGPGSRVIITQV